MTAIESVSFGLRVPSCANMREHWATKARRVKSQRTITAYALRNTAQGSLVLSAAELRPCTITLTRISPRELDGDNLQSAFKAIRDEVAKAIGVDDKDGASGVWWAYAQEKPHKTDIRKHRVRITVSERKEGNG